MKSIASLTAVLVALVLTPWRSRAGLLEERAGQARELFQRLDGVHPANLPREKSPAFESGAAAAHPLAGNWRSDNLSLSIDESGSVTTNVGTPAGYRQYFPGRLKWYSSSPTSGYYYADGYFQIVHGNFPFQVTCHHTVKLVAYIDQTSGALTANFYCPQEVWAVWQPDGGHCLQSGATQTQVQFTK